jgi:hypothetical protein
MGQGSMSFNNNQSREGIEPNQKGVHIIAYREVEEEEGDHREKRFNTE